MSDFVVLPILLICLLFKISTSVLAVLVRTLAHVSMKSMGILVRVSKVSTKAYIAKDVSILDHYWLLRVMP